MPSPMGSRVSPARVCRRPSSRSTRGPATFWRSWAAPTSVPSPSTGRPSRDARRGRRSSHSSTRRGSRAAAPPVTRVPGIASPGFAAALQEQGGRADPDDPAAALTWREALSVSDNEAAVAVLRSVGSPAVLDLALQVGLPAQPDVPSLALGTGQATPLELTVAYAPFANGGWAVDTRAIRAIEDQRGATVDEDAGARRRVLAPPAAFQALSMLRDVVTRGTGAAAQSLGFPVAGKTGTTDDYRDAWFVGFSSRLAAGVWVGFDQPKPIGEGASAARVALPIWTAFMRRAAAVLPPGEFDAAAGICRRSSSAASPSRHPRTGARPTPSTSRRGTSCRSAPVRSTAVRCASASGAPSAASSSASEASSSGDDERAPASGRQAHPVRRGRHRGLVGGDPVAADPRVSRAVSRQRVRHRPDPVQLAAAGWRRGLAARRRRRPPAGRGSTARLALAGSGRVHAGSVLRRPRFARRLLHPRDVRGLLPDPGLHGRHAGAVLSAGRLSAAVQSVRSSRRESPVSRRVRVHGRQSGRRGGRRPVFLRPGLPGHAACRRCSSPTCRSLPSAGIWREPAAASGPRACLPRSACWPCSRPAFSESGAR